MAFRAADGRKKNLFDVAGNRVVKSFRLYDV